MERPHKRGQTKLHFKKGSKEFEGLEFMSSTEAAQYLRLIDQNGQPNTKQLRAMVYDGRIPFYKPFGRLLFKKSELEKLINNSKRGGYKVGGA